MSGKYIYAIIKTSDNATLDITGLGSFSPVYTIAHQGLGCVLSDYSGREFSSMSKEELVRCLLAHQEVIERVMKRHTILPVKFGTLVEGDDEVRRVLQQGHGKLVETLNQMDGKVEMEVAATWDLKRVLQRIGGEEEIVRLRKSIANRPPSESLEQQIRAGRLVKESLDRRRDEFRDQMVRFLRETALDVQPNALVADEMVMNVAFLMQREREADFDNQVKQLDSIFHDQINFRIIGPLPPYSFSTVEVIRPSPEKIEEARQLLGLGTEVSEVEIKEAYRHLAAKSHPDACPGDELAEERFARVRQAFALLTDYCQGQSKGRGPDLDRQRFSLLPQDVSQAFLIRIKRSAPVG